MRKVTLAIDRPFLRKSQRVRCTTVVSSGSMLRQTSYGTLALVVGGGLTLIGLVAYFSGNATLNLAGFFYGIPLTLIGLALKSAELKPVPFTSESSPQLVRLRKERATPIQRKLIEDVTGYRYGQKAHLEEALDRLGLAPTDEERPRLLALKEAEIGGTYALILEFDSPLIPLETWQDKCQKMEVFFGPGLQVTVASREGDRVEVTTISREN